MQDRWDRLAGTLTDAGIPATVDRSAQGGEVFGHISLRVDGGLVAIRDTEWHRQWAGWQVEASGTDSLTVRMFPRTKKRNEVLEHVVAARATLNTLNRSTP